MQWTGPGQAASGARPKLWGGDGPQPGRWTDLHHGNRHRGPGSETAGLLHQGGGACPTGEGHDQHRGKTAGGGVGDGPGNGLLEQLAVADGPGSATVELPLGWHFQRRPAQLMGSPANGGIGPTGPAMEQQMHQPAASACKQLSGDALMGPGQITAATGRDHQ